MRVPVTVVTATIPSREQLLVKCLRSVYAQTVPVEAHLVYAQPPVPDMPAPVHCALMQNALLASVTTEWTMRLADDDQLLAHHVETLLPFLERADVAYSFDASGNRPRLDVTAWPQDKLVSTLEHGNFIDGSAVFYRTELLRQVGGWPTEWEDGRFAGMKAWFEDWGCFLELARAGARFVCAPEPTWLYNDGRHPRISNGDMNEGGWSSGR
jgi:hypothetical protein